MGKKQEKKGGKKKGTKPNKTLGPTSELPKTCVHSQEPPHEARERDGVSLLKRETEEQIEQPTSERGACFLSFFLSHTEPRKE